MSSSFLFFFFLFFFFVFFFFFFFLQFVRTGRVSSIEWKNTSDLFYVYVYLW